MVIFTDTHAHLDLPEYKGRIKSVLKNASENAVKKILCVSVSHESADRCIDLAEKFPEQIKATAGIHPTYVSGNKDYNFNLIRKMSSHPMVTAIGETGLDYHHFPRNTNLQESLLRRHIELSLELGKPVIIHCRKADEDLLKILDSYPEQPKVLRHCFDSTADIAQEYVKRGCYIAFGGLITKHGYKKLKKAVSVVTDEKVLLETDSPYMVPEGVQAEYNEPANITAAAEAMAGIRNRTVEEIALTTTENSLRLGLF